MLSSFYGLEVARRALQTQQQVLDITGHNIANANTPGYSRQIANLQATPSIGLQVMGRLTSMGTGVTLAEVTRARDVYLDVQWRNQTAKQQYWDSKQNTLSMIEGIFKEPSDNGLRQDLDNFWNAWSDLAKDPESLAARTVVKQQAFNLISNFHSMTQQAQELQENLDSGVRVQIMQVNSLAQQIADINLEINRREASGNQPNDLYDQRDKLVDELSKLIQVKVVEKSDPVYLKKYTVIIGDVTEVPPQVLVDGGNAYLLKENPPVEGDSEFSTIAWADDSANSTADDWGNTVNLGSGGGSLQAAIELRGDQSGLLGYLGDILTQINSLALGVAAAVNSLHQQGLDLKGNPGADFFVAIDNNEINALNIQLNPDIAGDPSRIAAASSNNDGGPGDSGSAQAIASLAEGWQSLTSIGLDKPLNAASFGSYYAAAVAKIGADAQEANRKQAMQEAMITQLTNQREAVSGVSLDEEMVNLVKYQKSYAAAARVVTIMDDLLETVIKGMGVTR